MATVRTADEGDLEDLAELFAEYLEFYRRSPDGQRCRNFLRNRLRNGDAVLLLAEAEGGAVGFAQLYPTWSSLQQSRSFILNDQWRCSV